MDCPPSEMVKIPNLLANWPWKRDIHPDYETVKAETESWIRSFEFFQNYRSQNAFHRVDAARLGALAYPYMNKDQLRIGSDFMALLYAYDEYTDVAEEEEARRLADIVLDAMRRARTENTGVAEENPHAELARQFWTRAIPHLSPKTQEHFLNTFAKYVHSVTEQVRDRASDKDRILGTDEYWAIRQHNCACLPCFSLGEFDMDIPDHVYLHPLLERIRFIAVQMIVLANDIYSYNIEVLRGMGLFNLVTIVIHENNFPSPKEALAWMADWNDKLVAEFLDLKEEISQLGVREESWSDMEEQQKQANRCVEILGLWVRANEEWSFESQRYFGTDGLRAREEREIVMVMTPRIDPRSSSSSQAVGVGSSAGDSCASGAGVDLENASGSILSLMAKTEVAGMQISVKRYQY